MICACCGLEIKDEAHGPYSTLSGHEDYVCTRCWKDPNLSFPDKIPDFPIPSLVGSFDLQNILGSDLFQSRGSSKKTLKVNVIKVSQGNVTSFIGKMKAIDILSLYDLRRYNELTQNGYQRQIYKERKREIAFYLRECPFPIIPTIFVSIRDDTKFVPAKDDSHGVLEIPRKEGSIVLIDGQHRMSGFRWFAEELAKWIAANQSEIEDMRTELAKFVEILNYEISVLFLDSNSALEVISTESTCSGTDKNQQVANDDVERAIFYIVNKTQKAINPSLKDTLQFHIYRSGIRGIPTIEREQWRVEAAEIAHILNKKTFPLEGKINLSGARGSGKPLQLNSWVSSLEPLFSLNSFERLNSKEKLAFLEAFWEIISKLFQNAFKDTKTYLLLKSIGVYTLNKLAANIFEWCVSEGEINQKTIVKFLEPLENFNWRSKEPEASPLKGLGGKVGVKEAYKILLKVMANGGIEEAITRIKKLETDQAFSR